MSIQLNLALTTVRASVYSTSHYAVAGCLPVSLSICKSVCLSRYGIV